MGADLYCGALYFRDSYNETSLMSRLQGVSWRDAWDGIEGENLREFRESVANARIILPPDEPKENPLDIIKAFLSASGHSDFKIAPNPITQEELLVQRDYFLDKHRSLLEFLDEIILLGKPLELST